MTWFRALPLLWRLLTIIGLIGALGGSVWGVYAYVRHQGYVEGHDVAQAECEAERKAQQEANEKAFAEALNKLLKAAEEINQKQTEIDDAPQGIDDAVAQDPDGDIVCLDVDGVRRLQAFH